jgi:hypothetical protein
LIFPVFADYPENGELRTEDQQACGAFSGRRFCIWRSAKLRIVNHLQNWQPSVTKLKRKCSKNLAFHKKAIRTATYRLVNTKELFYSAFFSTTMNKPIFEFAEMRMTNIRRWGKIVKTGQGGLGRPCRIKSF